MQNKLKYHLAIVVLPNKTNPIWWPVTYAFFSACSGQILSLPVGTLFCNGLWGRGEVSGGSAGAGNQVSNSLSIQIAQAERASDAGSANEN